MEILGLFELSLGSRIRTDSSGKQSRQGKHSNNLLRVYTFPERMKTQMSVSGLEFAKSFLNYLFTKKQ